MRSKRRKETIGDIKKIPEEFSGYRKSNDDTMLIFSIAKRMRRLAHG